MTIKSILGLMSWSEYLPFCIIVASVFFTDQCQVLPESKCAVISEISNASKMERNGAVKMENTDALF